MQMATGSPPLACIAVQDEQCRAAIVQTLQHHGWSVIERPTGIHLLDSISGAILGEEPAPRPGLIVADARARGCTGTSIARGLLDLGLRIPTVVVTDHEERAPPMNDNSIAIASTTSAPAVVAQLAASAGPTTAA